MRVIKRNKSRENKSSSGKPKIKDKNIVRRIFQFMLKIQVRIATKLTIMWLKI